MFETHRRLAESVGGEALAAGTKAAPPVTVTGLTVAGVGLQDWVLIATLVYTTVQIILLLPKVVAFGREWRRG